MSTIYIKEANDESLAEAVDVVRAGGIVAHATETCYGFACDITNKMAVEKLFAIKRRPKKMPVSALFISVEEAGKWVEWNDVAERIAAQYLPGALTLVLPVRDSSQMIYSRPACARSRSSQRDGKVKKGRVNAIKTLGIRISSHPVASRLASLSGVPLSTTSANLHGCGESYSAEEIVVQFAGCAVKPDLILNSGKLPKAKPSTVIIIKESGFEIVREGVVSVFA